MPSERYARLRERLEAKQQEFIAALKRLSNAPAPRSTTVEVLTDGIFNLLGVVTFWLSLDEPSETIMETIERQLDEFRVGVFRRTVQ